MPELPEVETVVRDLRPLVVGRRLTSVSVGKKALRKRWVAAWKHDLLDQTVQSITRRGKWMFLRLDRGWTLVVHLGMTGQFVVVPVSASREPHTHIVFGLDGGTSELRFRDVRRFGSVTALRAGDEVEHFMTNLGLGPEPFNLPAKYWQGRLAATDRCVKAVLLDQRVVAGVGNIYADESLFAARLHPARLGSSLSAREAAALRRAVAKVLTRAIEERGSSIRDYVGGNGSKGGFQDEFCVYGRDGQPCVRCGATIALMRLAGRSTHFCPSCQKV